MSIVRFLLFIGFLPVLMVFWIGWWIYQKFWGKSLLSFKNQSKKAKQKQEFRKKWSKHLLNFAPSRLKNRTWQKGFSKKKQKKSKKPKS